MSRLGALVRQHYRNPNAIAYAAMLVVALAFPEVVQFVTAGTGAGDALIQLAADGGVFILLAIGLNVVVGFAGLLDLGYAAFFAIGAYTYGILASPQLSSVGIPGGLHLPFWIAIFIAMLAAAGAGALLGAPTLRLRGDYLAIVTLGFGEIVPAVIKKLLPSHWTGAANGISSIDTPVWFTSWIDGPWNQGDPRIYQVVSPATGLPDSHQFFRGNGTAFYVLMVVMLFAAVILVNNLYRSRLGRAWMAVREDEVAAASMGVNTTNVKLLAFGIGAAFSGFAGAYFGAKLGTAQPVSFEFVVSITVLAMVVLGGIGNIPGVMIGAAVLYYILYKFLPDAPLQAEGLAKQFGLTGLIDPQAPGSGAFSGWPGIREVVSRSKFVVYGLVVVLIMLLRPQGLLPSRVRQAELRPEPVEEGAN